MGAIFDFIAIPLGWLLKFIYDLIPNYFVAIFLFTLLVRVLLFPLSLKSQKSQADRARLAPRLERLQKKYAQDPKKLQEKQRALYEKEGVSMTGGCLPMLLQMVVLFGIISVIYSPLSHLADVPDPVVNAAMTAMTGEGEEDAKNFQGYYKEQGFAFIMLVAGQIHQQVLKAVKSLNDNAISVHDVLLMERCMKLELRGNHWNLKNTRERDLKILAEMGFQPQTAIPV